MIQKPSTEELQERIPLSEIVFTASRSSGPGGQNVNKVNTKIEIRFNVLNSSAFSDEEKELLSARLGKRINLSGEIVMRSQSERTQMGNKNRAYEKLLVLLSGALAEYPDRIKTSPSERSVRKRVDEKRQHGKLKEIRRGKDLQNNYD